MLGHAVHSRAAHQSRRARSLAPRMLFRATALTCLLHAVACSPLAGAAACVRRRRRGSAARARRPALCSPALLLRVLTLLPARSPATTVLVRAAACSARSRAGRSLESPRSLAGVAECVRRRCCRSAARARRLAPCSSVSPLQALALPAVRAHAAGLLDGRRWPCVRWPSLD